MHGEVTQLTWLRLHVGLLQLKSSFHFKRQRAKISNLFRHLIQRKTKNPLFPQVNAIVLLGAKKKYLLLSTVGASYLLCLSPNTKCAGFLSHFHWKTEEELSSANFHHSWLISFLLKKRKTKKKKKKENLKKKKNLNPFQFVHGTPMATPARWKSSFIF